MHICTPLALHNFTCSHASRLIICPIPSKGCSIRLKGELRKVLASFRGSVLVHYHVATALQSSGAHFIKILTPHLLTSTFM